MGWQKQMKQGTKDSKIYAFEGLWFLYKVCWRYNRRYIVLLFFQEIIAIAAPVITLLLPKYIINYIFVDGDYLRGIQYLIALLVVSLISGILQTVISSKSMVARTIVFKHFQSNLCRRIMSVKFERTETAEFLDLKAKAEQFISSGGQGFAVILEQAFGIVGTAISLGAYAIIISQLNILLILLVLILTGLSIWLNYHLSQKNIEINLEKSIQERRAAYFMTLTQHFKYGKEIRTNDCSDWVSKRYEGQLNILQRFYEKICRYGIKYGCLILLTGIAQRALTYLYLIYTAFTKGILVGDFSVYLSAVECFSGGMKSLIGGIASLNQYNKYYEAFKEYYYISDKDALPKDIAVPMPELDRKLTIQFHDVSFRYPNAEQYALANVNCIIHRGDIISIVGDNGAGKSTFIKLLLRLYEPTEGYITINDVDISTIDRSEYARCFACVFQDFQLLSFSVEDNITLGSREELNYDQLDYALRFVNLTGKIEQLEKGTETMVYRDFDKEGFTPSGGEAQRLAVARAIYRDSEVLILDEPTSSLDPNIEYELNQKIRGTLYGKKTIINVSHRLHSVRYSNQIFVFRGGKLVESGTHETLFASPTLYRQMFERQASDYMDIPSHPELRTIQF